MASAPTVPTPARTAVLILGMHRSGTSALTRALNLLGVELGHDLMAAAADNNETGFWEHQGVVDAHEALMAELGMRWDDPRAMPENWLTSEAARTARETITEILDREFSDTPLWGVKDPRLCRLLPLWLPILEARGDRVSIVHMVRNPLEIARSLERRDGTPRGRGLLLWLRHQIEAIRASTDLPGSWARYNGLMTDWRGCFQGIEDDLGLGLRLDDATASDAIEGFIRPGLRHHVLDGEVLTSEPHLSNWVGALYRATEGQDPERRLAEAKRIEVELDRMSFYFDDTFAGWAARELVLLEQVRERDGSIRERDAWIQERDLKVTERDNWLQHRDHALQQRDHALREQSELNRQLGARIAKLEESIEAERQDLAEARLHLDGQLAATEFERDHLARHIESIRRSTLWRLMGPIRVTSRAARRLMHFGKPVPLAVMPRQHLALDPFGLRPAGDDPYLFLTSRTGAAIPTGRVRLAYTFEAEDRRVGSPRLYWDTGSDFVADGSIPLPAGAEGHVNVTISLPPGTQRLRFDPPRGSGPFRLTEVTVQPLDTVSADLRAGLSELKRSLRSPSRLVRLSRAVYRYLRGGSNGTRDRRAGPLWAGQGSSYQDWVRWYDQLDEADIRAIEARIEAMKTRPMFSVVMPVYNPPHDFLRQAIESVQAQIYPDWELCIANDKSPDPEITRILDAFAADDPRIKVVHREENGHISRASNSALEIASGDFVALLDHDDVLSRHALYMVAEELQHHRDAEVIYSDEDKLDQDGIRTAPYFKPDFNWELFRGQNFVSHLGVYKRELLTEIGGFRVGFEGSQDYDLALRAIEHCGPDKVRHIPHILYHWRILEGSVAMASDEKDYAHERALKAVREHLSRYGLTAEVQEIAHGRYRRVIHALPEPAPRVSIIVPTRDRLDLLRVAVESLIEKTEYPDYEIIIVDNGSEERETLAWLDATAEAHDFVTVLRDEGPFNYSRLNNRAIAQASGAMILLLNNDTEVIDGGWLTEMVGHACQPDVGAVGAKLYYTDGRVQHAGVVIGLGGIAGHIFRMAEPDDPCYFAQAMLARSFSAATAACLLVRRDVFDAVDGLDETHLGVAFNDVDLCLKIVESGKRVVWTPFAELKHHESASRGEDNDHRKRARFQREIDYMKARWAPIIRSDPYYNPNLSLLDFNCALAFPPRAPVPWKSVGDDAGQ